MKKSFVMVNNVLNYISTQSDVWMLFSPLFQCKQSINNFKPQPKHVCAFVWLLISFKFHILYTLLHAQLVLNAICLNDISKHLIWLFFLYLIITFNFGYAVLICAKSHHIKSCQLIISILWLFIIYLSNKITYLFIIKLFIKSIDNNMLSDVYYLT